MERFILRRAIDLLRLIDSRAKGMVPGDDALSRLRLDQLAAAPLQWLRNTFAKLAVVVVLAALVAGVFSGGIAVMKAMESSADSNLLPQAKGWVWQLLHFQILQFEQCGGDFGDGRCRV